MMRGSKHTPATIAKMRAVRLGRKNGPATIAKMRAVQLGRKHTPATIAKIRAAKLVWTDEMTEAALALRAGGASMVVTAEKVGVSAHALRRHLTELGVPTCRARRTTGAQDRSASAAAQP